MGGAWLMPPWECAGTHCIVAWAGPNAGVEGCGKVVPIRIRSLDRPARSKSLHRLSYPGPRKKRRLVVPEDDITDPTVSCINFCGRRYALVNALLPVNVLQALISTNDTVTWSLCIILCAVHSNETRHLNVV